MIRFSSICFGIRSSAVGKGTHSFSPLLLFISRNSLTREASMEDRGEEEFILSVIREKAPILTEGEG